MLSLLTLTGGCALLQKDDDASTVAPAVMTPAPEVPPLVLPPLEDPKPHVTGPGAGGAANEGEQAPACDELEGLSACGATAVVADIRTVNMLVVIDKSGSMTDMPEGFETDKWSAVKSALGEALSGVAADVNLGLLMYPYSQVIDIQLACREGCCEVPEAGDAVNVDIDTGTKSLPRVLSALDATSPGGGTPTAAALARADEYFTSGAGAKLTGKSYVLLATDGGPNCNDANACGADRCTTNLDGQCDGGNCCQGSGERCLDDAAVTKQIASLRGHGVSTFVVGIPGTENYGTYLDDFARAGGVARATAPAYLAVNAAGGVRGLVDAFTSITTQLVRSCHIPLATRPPKLMDVNLAIDCQVIKPTDDDGSGWELNLEGDNMELVLKGPLCERVEAEGVQRIDVVYGCPTVR